MNKQHAKTELEIHFNLLYLISFLKYLSKFLVIAQRVAKWSLPPGLPLACVSPKDAFQQPQSFTKYNLWASEHFMGEDVPLNTLCMNCSSQEERSGRKSYLLFDNTARREAVWGMAISTINNTSTFSNEELNPKLAIFFSWWSVKTLLSRETVTISIIFNFRQMCCQNYNTE